MKLTAESNFKVTTIAGLFLFISSFSNASFEPLPVGGRAAGMGEAYTAIVDDVFSLYYNPAGVLQLDRPEIGTYYSNMYLGLTDNSRISRTFVGYAQPLGKMGKKGGMGGSYLSLDLPGLYKEQSIGFTYGREFDHRYNVGIGLKYLTKQIGSDEFTSNAIDPFTGDSKGIPDPVLAGVKSKSAFGLDLGLQYRLSKSYALGFAARNINSPDVSLSGGSDKAPAITTLAIARKMRAGSLDIEAINWKGAENNMRFAMGGEHWFKNGFALRAGGGFGSRSYSSISFGASYKMESIQLDYATVLPLQGIQTTLGSQQISLTIRLGKPPVDPMEAQLIKEKEERVRAETEARNAMAERDRLKKQLLSLTEAKSKAQQNREEEAARQALEEAKAQVLRREKEASAPQNRPDTTSANEYTNALSDYNDKVRKGITLEEKEQILSKLMTRFGRSNIDLSTIKREMKSLEVEKIRARKDFDLSLNFYQRLVQQGANTEERRGMLQRIIQKYKGSGVDVKSAEDEMRLLPK